MRKKRHLAKRLFIAFLIIAAGLPAVYAQQAPPDLTTQQLSLEIQSTEAKGNDYKAWPPALQQAYDKSLMALYQAYQQALEKEMERVGKMLYDISEPTARKPFEEHLAQLARARTEVKAKKQALSGNAYTVAAAKQPPDGAKDTSMVIPAIASTPANLPGASFVSGVTERTSGLRRAATPVNNAVAFVSPPQGGAATVTVKVKVLMKGTSIAVQRARVSLYQIVVSGTQSFLQSSASYSGLTSDDGKVTLADVATDQKYKLVVERYKFYTHVDNDPLDLAGKSGEVTRDVSLAPLGVERYRAVLGIEQNGASSAESKQNIFFNLFVSRPIGRQKVKGADITGKTSQTAECAQEPGNTKEVSAVPGGPCFDVPRLRLWGDFRLTSIPDEKQNVFQGFTNNFSTTLTSGVSSLKSSNQVAFGFLTGVQFRLFSGYIGGQRFDVDLVAGGGATTPLATADTVELFKIPTAATDLVRLNRLKDRLRQIDPNFNMANLEGKENIAFVLKDRDRFFRNYYGGFRFENYYGDPETNRPTAQFDIMFGQDEAVTGGRLRGGVMRLDGFFPLPVTRGNLIYLFGTANLGLRRNNDTEPLLLPAADGTATASNPNTVVFPINAPNRDLYRIGIGLNLFNLFNSGGAKP